MLKFKSKEGDKQLTKLINEIVIDIKRRVRKEQNISNVEKVDKINCNNYRRITLASVLDK